MKTENEIVIWKNLYAIKRGEKFPICQMRDALDAGGRVTLLIRRAERPPLDPGDPIFGASLSLTRNGWRCALDFGLMLTNNLLSKVQNDELDQSPLKGKINESQ